jgi:hypothetical protein
MPLTQVEWSPPRIAIILRRWAYIIGLAVLGLLFVLLAGPSFESWAIRAGEAAAARFPTWLRYAIALTFSAIVAMLLGHLGAVRRIDPRTILAHPPTWVAAAIAVALAFTLKGIHPAIPIPEAEVPSWALTLAIFASGIALWLTLEKHPGVGGHRRVRAREAAGVPSSEAIRHLAGDIEHGLLPWLEREQPVDTPDRDDIFDLRHAARRIAEYLHRDRLGTVGLVGHFGAGKSSVIRFVEHYLDGDPSFDAEMRRPGPMRTFAKRVLLCRVSAWGMVDEAGVASILRQAVERVAREADCLALVNLPEQYVQAAKEAGSGWLHLPIALRSSDDEIENLRRLDRLLFAIGRRLVIAIEDIDRNIYDLDGAADASVTRSLQAMLSDLRDLDHIGFLLAISNPGVVAMSRLCDRIEWIRPLAPASVAPVVKALRSHCLEAHRWHDDVPMHATSPQAGFEAGDFTPWEMIDDPSLIPPELAICKLLTNPRSLKSTLRQALHSWSRLHGEVSFDHLLICTVIRAVAPEALDFLVSHRHALTARDRVDGQEIAAKIEADWGAASLGCGAEEKGLLNNLIARISPAWRRPGIRIAEMHDPQGADHDVYFGRILRGEVAELIGDQVVGKRVLQADCPDTANMRRSSEG